MILALQDLRYDVLAVEHALSRFVDSHLGPLGVKFKAFLVGKVPRPSLAGPLVLSSGKIDEIAQQLNACVVCVRRHGVGAFDQARHAVNSCGCCEAAACGAAVSAQQEIVCSCTTEQIAFAGKTQGIRGELGKQQGKTRPRLWGYEIPLWYDRNTRGNLQTPLYHLVKVAV